jgi:type I restriction enzyme M protein
VSHDPNQLLADYARLQAESQALRDQLKAALAGAFQFAARP